MNPCERPHPHRLLSLVVIPVVALTLASCSPDEPGGPAAAGSPTAEAPPTQAPEPTPGIDAAALQSLLEEEAKQIQGNPAVHVRILTEAGEVEAGMDADRSLEAASVIKLPLMAVVFDAWQAGTLERTSEDEERVRKMITVSDNPAANSFIRRLGPERINDWLKEHGYGDTQVRRQVTVNREKDPNVVSARDMTRMLAEIAKGALVSEEASREMREILLAQTRRTRIPAGLPKGATVGNKTGTLRGVIHDVALVETPEGTRYALAVLVEDAAPDAAASRSIARLSRRVHEFLTPARIDDPSD